MESEKIPVKILICCKNKHSSSGRHIYLIIQTSNITNNCLYDKSSFSLPQEMPQEEHEGWQSLQLCPVNLTWQEQLELTLSGDYAAL